MTLHEELRALIELWRGPKRAPPTVASWCADELSALLARHPEQAAPGLSEARHHERCPRFTGGLDCFCHEYAPAQPAQPAPSEPERAATERLGRWLAAKTKRYYESGEATEAPGVYWCELLTAETDGVRVDWSIAWGYGTGDTPHDAINAALDQAERKGDTSSRLAQPDPSEPERSQRWRVGHKLGRTLYLDDALVGLIDTPEIAARLVAALNEAERKVDT